MTMKFDVKFNQTKQYMDVDFKNVQYVNVGGESDYENLENKPQINAIELNGNKTAKELLLQEAMIPVSNEEIDKMFK